MYIGSPPYSTKTGSLTVLPRRLRLRPVRRESTDRDLDLDFDLDLDRDTALSSFLDLRFSYSPAMAAPATPAAAIGTPSRVRLRDRLPSRFRDLLRRRSTRPATAALAKPTCAALLLRCFDECLCLLLLRDLPPSVSITVTDLDLPLPLLERDLCRCFSVTVTVSLSFLRPAAYASAPTPAMAARAPNSLTLDLLRCRDLSRLPLPRSDERDRDRDRSRLLNLSKTTAPTAPNVP